MCTGERAAREGKGERREGRTMRTGPGDDELNGAAAALLGLHSSAR